MRPFLIAILTWAAGSAACGANETFQFGRFEWLIGYFHARIDAALAGSDPVGA